MGTNIMLWGGCENWPCDCFQHFVLEQIQNFVLLFAKTSAFWNWLLKWIHIIYISSKSSDGKIYNAFKMCICNIYVYI